METPFVAFWLAPVEGAEPRLAWKGEGDGDALELERWAREQIRRAENGLAGTPGVAARIRSVQLGEDGIPWRAGAPPTSLALANVSFESRAPGVLEGTPARGGARGPRVDRGWLLVASSRPLSGREEVLLLAAAQRLGALARNAEDEAELRLRDQFLSIASHELKTPLTSIYGILQLEQRLLRAPRPSGGASTPVPEDPKERSRRQSYLEIVIRQTQRLNELIDALLDVSRIQNGRFVAEPSICDAAALLRETVGGRLAVLALEAGVRLNVDAPAALPAWVDPVRLEEVITNLVMNAIRFSPEGGAVSIRLWSDEVAMHLTIRDQGPPVAAEDRERIFHPFERAQRTARFGGLGLGLFISRQIARLHGGDITLGESLPGRGNLFEAVFPQRTPMVQTA